MSSQLKPMLFFGIVTGVIVLFIFLSPSLIFILWAFGVTPGSILMLFASIVFYLGLFSVFWCFGPFAKQPASILFGSSAVLAVAVGVPIALNSLTREALAAANAQDFIPATPLPPSHTIAIRPAEESLTGVCGDLCLLLLYNGAAKQVISLPGKSQSYARPPMVYWISSDAPCTGAQELVGGANKTGGWNLGTSNSTAIVKAAHVRIASGDCLNRAPAIETKSDLLIQLRLDVPDTKKIRTQLTAGSIIINRLELLQDNKVVARGSKNGAVYFSLPLRLQPKRQSFSQSLNLAEAIQGWGWAGKEFRYNWNGFDVLSQLGRFTSFRLTTLDGGDGATIRRLLDVALANPQLPANDPIFGLIADYYEVIHENELEKGDFARLKNLLKDKRVIEFQSFPVHKLSYIEKIALREPIVGRIEGFDPVKTYHHKALEAILFRLPPPVKSTPKK